MDTANNSVIRTPTLMLCCYYPTTILAIDDDENFLRTISQHLVLPNCIPFTSPEAAISFLQKQSKFDRIRNRLQKATTYITDESHADPEHLALFTNLKKLHEEIYSAERFQDVSVIIVDYHMAGMNGIEVCEKLSHLPIKKILLTGGADKERVAIEAFNKGIIHRFISKSDTNFPAQLKQAVELLKSAFFKDLSNALQPTSSIPLLENPAFTNFIRNIQTQINAVEYYLLDSSGSFIFLDETGAQTWCIVKNKSELDDYAQIANDMDGPKDIISSIARQEKIPFFFSEADYQQPIEKWEKYLHTAQPLPGIPGHYYALVNENSSNKLNNPISYSSYQHTQSTNPFIDIQQ